MTRRTGRWSAAVLAALLSSAALVGGVGVGLVPGAAAAGRPAQATTVPAPGAAPATTVLTAAPPVETAVATATTTVPASDQVGDPTADRRIRTIVLALGALALVVLLTTIVFWRKTKPVPAALDGLRRLGSRSGRQAAQAVEAAGVAPPSVAGGGVPSAGVSVRQAAVPVAVAAGEADMVAAAGDAADAPAVQSAEDIIPAPSAAPASAAAGSPPAEVADGSPPAEVVPSSSAAPASPRLARRLPESYRCCPAAGVSPAADAGRGRLAVCAGSRTGVCPAAGVGPAAGAGRGRLAVCAGSRPRVGPASGARH